MLTTTLYAALVDSDPTYIYRIQRNLPSPDQRNPIAQRHANRIHSGYAALVAAPDLSNVAPVLRSMLDAARWLAADAKRRQRNRRGGRRAA